MQERTCFIVPLSISLVELLTVLISGGCKKGLSVGFARLGYPLAAKLSFEILKVLQQAFGNHSFRKGDFPLWNQSTLSGLLIFQVGKEVRGEAEKRKKSKQADLYVCPGRLSTTGYCSGHCPQPTALASMGQV